MPKIKIEIEISGEEIVGIISGLLEAKMDHSIGKSYARYKFNDFSKADNPYKVPRKRPLRQKKKTRIMKKKKTSSKLKRGARWTTQEIAWLKNYLKGKPVSKTTVADFQKQFGYKRSYSSLSNKAFLLRKK